MLRKIEGDWPRRPHYDHYMNELRCTFSLTVDIDITQLRAALKENGLRAYPAQIYMLAAAVNRLPAFRMGRTEAGEPGYWDEVHPSYTVFNPESETFSSIWTRFDEGFAVFYQAVCDDMEQYGNSTKFEPKPGMPPNIFNVSSLPWVDFTAFNLNVFGEGNYLAPIFTIGKYTEGGGKTSMPLAMQLHHAACDGYHAGQFVTLVREMAETPGSWLQL